MEDNSCLSVERVARNAWQRALRVEHITATDDFFELGGHSLSAMRVIMMLRRDLATDIPVEVLLDHPEFSRFVRAVGESIAVPVREG